jgi:DNA polymerase-1
MDGLNFMLNEKLLLIDGNSILNRAFYGLQGAQLLSTSDGLYTNGIYGFLNILFKYLEEEQPQYICVAFDMKGPTFRHKEYSDYKANRKGMPQELAVQVPVLKEVLDAMNVTRVEYESYEADDLIGWLSSLGEKEGMEVVIVTGDRDSFQLISDNTRVKLPITRYGKTQTEEYDYDAFYDKYKIKPEQMVEVKALMGDPSDNIPGIKGIGEKTALKLIKEFKTIENLYKNVSKIESNNIKSKLENEKEKAFLSKKLATIKRDVPEDICSLNQLKMRKYDINKLYEIFKRLEFKSLIDKLELQPGIDKDMAKSKNNLEITHVKDIEKLKRLKESLIIQKEISFFHILDKDTGFEKNKNLAGSLYGLALFWDENKAAFISINAMGENDFVEEFKDILNNTDIKKCGHNVKDFLLYLKGLDTNLKGLVFDTMLGGYVLNPSRETYLVSELSSEYLKESIVSVEGLLKKGKSHTYFKDIPYDDMAYAACGYAEAIFRLWDAMGKLIKSLKQEILYYNIELPLIEVLADMEFNGFKINKNELINLSEEFDEKIKVLEKEIHDMAGEDFNINSPKQLGIILFEKLKLPVRKRNKTGYSTAREVLEQLVYEHAIIPNILEYRQLAKLKSTYTDGLINMINPETKKVHSKFNQTVVVTGRISSTEPNMQNIPIKLDIGRRIRKVFESTSEDFVLVDADYSQIELRVLAHISADKNLIDAFKNNEDIHASTASKVFGIPQNEVTPLMRARAKAVNFGIIYGIGDFSLAKDLGVTRKEAKEYIDGYLGKYPQVKQYMHDAIALGKKLGYIETMFNRRRYLPELMSKNFNIRSFGERIALNTPIQGSAADIIKIAMVNIYKRLKDNKMKSRLILQVHDELIIETHKDEKEEVISILKECMEGAVDLKVPLKVDISEGKNWYDAK